MKAKTLVGIVTFGNADFTRLAISELLATTQSPIDLFIVVGQPDDLATHQMLDWLADKDCRFLDKFPFPSMGRTAHQTNQGFPASLNDLMDEAWTLNDYDQLIIMGNDVVPLPGAIDAMIEEAARGEYEWICASQFDVKSLCDRYPEARPYFAGANYTFTDFQARPWELHEATRKAELQALGEAVIQAGSISDVRNLCLFKRSVFERLGYADVNYWPGGYFEDNDYCRRGLLGGVKACTLKQAAYFHFWSRTIHQGAGSTTARQFERNRCFYRQKWGGQVNEEKFARPFDDQHQSIGIFERDGEASIIAHWSSVNPSLHHSTTPRGVME